MTFIRYEDANLRAETLKMIDGVNHVVGLPAYQGLPLTLRQIYYQFVARGWFENVPGNYDKLKKAVSRGRMAGLISWTSIEDRTRNLRGHETWTSPAAAVRQLREDFKMDLWADQPFVLECWVEKQGMEGIVAQACDELRVDYFAVRGYNSQSEQWRAGQRFARAVTRGQRPVVLYLGDHDPSGCHMTEDHRKRLATFAGVPVQVVRVALNMDQIVELAPPPNPVKPTDSRTPEYVATYGTEECWEMDALPPDSIKALIEKAVMAFRDEKTWEESLAREAFAREDLDEAVKRMGEE